MRHPIIASGSPQPPPAPPPGEGAITYIDFQTQYARHNGVEYEPSDFIVEALSYDIDGLIVPTHGFSGKPLLIAAFEMARQNRFTLALYFKSNTITNITGPLLVLNDNADTGPFVIEGFGQFIEAYGVPIGEFYGDTPNIFLQNGNNKYAVAVSWPMTEDGVNTRYRGGCSINGSPEMQGGFDETYKSNTVTCTNWPAITKVFLCGSTEWTWDLVGVTHLQRLAIYPAISTRQLDAFLILEQLPTEPVYNFSTHAKLELKFDGTDGQTTFVDTSPSGLVISRSGEAQLDSAWAALGPTSLLLDGSGNDYVYTPDNVIYNLGSEPFCIDFYVRFATIPPSNNFRWLIQKYSSQAVPYAWTIRWYNQSGNNGPRFEWTKTGVAGNEFRIPVNDPNIAVAANVMYRITVSYSSEGLLRFFVNGVLKQKLFLDVIKFPFYDSGQGWIIGATLGGSQNHLHGWIDEFLLTKGATPYPNDTMP